MDPHDARSAQGRPRKLSGFEVRSRRKAGARWDAYQKLPEEQKKKLAATKGLAGDRCQCAAYR